MSDQPSTSAERFLFPEETILRGDFKHYFLTKRFNFIATLNNHRDLSDLFLHIDQDWLEAITDLSQISNNDWIVPVQLTIFCFRELRLAAEMLLSGCTTPGFSHLRSALESFVHAQKIMREPALGAVWLCRDDNQREYERHFKRKLKDNLFPETSGLQNLHGIWKMLCDAGPHPSVTSVGVSSTITETQQEMRWSLDFFEVRQAELNKNLLFMLSISLELYKFTYSSFHERLSANPERLKRLYSHLNRFQELKSLYGPPTTP
jgi:hypothetical protein